MMRQINLFNPALLPKKHYVSAKSALQLLGVVLLALGAFIAYNKIASDRLHAQLAQNAKQLANLQGQLQKMNSEFAPRQKSLTLEQDVQSAEQRLQGIRQLQTALVGGNFGSTTGYAVTMSALARQTTPGVWLTGLDVDAGNSNIALHGRALQAGLLPQYVQSLRSEASFQGKSFASLDVSLAKPEAGARATNGKEAPFVEFSLRSQFAGAGR